MDKTASIRSIISLIIFLLGNFLYGQSTVSGTVRDTIGNPIASANVFLKQKDTQSIITFTYTDQKGDYTLPTEEVGDFIVSFSALGYVTKNFSIQLVEKTIIQQNVILNSTSYELDEVIIQSERAITEKKDTIVFDASSFTQGEETVIEDLLKKLPGVQVSETGTIKVDGQEIEKVMVEGDDFFRKGYKLLTKNLDVHAVDKVEVLRRYSNNKLLKGIEESEKVALNLKLDENFKREWFGAATPGYGVVSENRYDVDANASSFGRKNKYFLLGSFNNVGEDVTEDVRGLIESRTYGEPGNVGEEEEGYELIRIHGRVPGLKKSRTNFNNAELLSLNSIFKLSPKVNLKVLGLFNGDDTKFFKDGFETFNSNGAGFTNTEQYTLGKSTQVGFGRVELTYDVTDTSVLEYEGKFNHLFQDTDTQLTFNSIENTESLVTTREQHDHKIKYSNRFGEKKVLVFSARYIQEERPQEYKTNQFLFPDLFPANDLADNLRQESENKFKYIGFKAHLLDKRRNDDLLDLNLGYEHRKDQLWSKFFLNDGGNTIATPDSFINNVDYQVHDLFVGAGYLKKIEKVKIAFNAEGHQLFNSIEESLGKSNEQPLFFNSELNFNWEIDRSNRITVYAEHNNTNAKISDVYSNYVLTGYRNFLRGTGQFNQLNGTKAFAGYNLGNFGDRFIANFSFLYAKDNNFLSTNSTIAPNVALTDKIIIRDKEFYSAKAYLDRYFRFIRTNLKLKLNYSLSDFKNIVNSANLRTVENENVGYGFELRSGFRGIFNYHLGSTWNTSAFRTNITNTANQNISFLDLSFVFRSKLNLQLQSERYFYDNLERGDKDYYFLDFELTYKTKKNKLNFSLIGNNLLNSNTFRNYVASDTNISSTSYRLLPRYLLLKASLRF